MAAELIVDQGKEPECLSHWGTPCAESITCPLSSKGELKSSAQEESLVSDDTVTLDLLVIGAGPHSLSLLSRLVDEDPDLLTEKQRSHAMSKAKYARSKAAVREHLTKSYDATTHLPKTLVVDSHGSWMAQWAADFKAFGIEFLRSHQHMHCCPFDFQSLQVWGEEQGRSKELRAMEHVDRDESRKAGYYGPFVVPSSSLFLDFCYSLVERYNLAPLVSRGTVEDVRIMHNGLFEVSLGEGTVYTARKVVCAMGPGPAFQGMRATLPQWADEMIADTNRVQHSSSLSKGLLSKRVEERHLDGARVLVIGGGQTAAHLCHVALHSGAKHVTLCSRRGITRKIFDVDTRMMGDRRPSVLRQFWGLDAKKRMQFNTILRQGGSMSSDIYNSLQLLDGESFELMEGVEVEQGHWLEEQHRIHVRFDNARLESYDYIWLATGGDFDMDLVPVLASLKAQHPIECVDGLPALQEDLSWAPNVPLFVMGAFAQLQLGADALNLAGARSGSVLVARALVEEKQCE